MSIVVTGATGHLGRLVVQALLDRGIPADRIVAAGRNTDQLGDLADRGVAIRRVDYNAPATLKEAFAGADRLLLVSSSEVGSRIQQHRNVVDAARDAGVELIAYTSAVRADSTELLLAAEHNATEAYIRESGLPFVFLRNSWYVENYTAQIPVALENGMILGAAGGGRVSAATRADLAEAAAVVLSEDTHAGAVYELGGDDAFTMEEYAALLSDKAGQAVAYHDLTRADYATTLMSVGLPEELARVLADSDAGIARGDLLVETGDLSRLIGRATTSIDEAVVSALL